MKYLITIKFKNYRSILLSLQNAISYNHVRRYVIFLDIELFENI